MLAGSSWLQYHMLPWLSLQGPRCILEYNPIPIEILKRLPLGFPIGIIRGNTLESRCEHPGTTGFPLVLIGQVEDQQVILCRGSADLVSPLGGEFQMVGLLGMSKDDAIEAVMVVKLGEDREAEPCGIHLG